MADVSQPMIDIPESAQPRDSRRLIYALLIQAAVVVGLLALYYNYILNYLFHRWWNDSDWSHGFIIPLFGIYFLYQNRDRMPLGLQDRSWISRTVGVGLLLLGFALFMQSMRMMMTYPQAVSLIITILGIVMLIGGWPTARWSWFAVAFLFFALPLPARVYEQLTIPLRQVAAVVSAGVLSLVPEMEAEANGTLVNTLYKGVSGKLDIERACSGMRLLMTMSALGVAMAFVHRRPIWQRMILILSCVPIAIFCNFVRVTTTGFLFVFGRDDLAGGVPHTLLGIIMLFLAFGLHGGLSYLLSHLFVEGDDAEDEDGPEETSEAPAGGQAV